MRLLNDPPAKICIAALICSLFVGGCVSRPSEQASAGELLILGREDLKAERFESAREAFKKLLREHPDSKHRRQALINLADTYYNAGEYTEAKVQYEEYVQLYPISAQTPKAYFFLGMSDYNTILAVDRDQESTRQALKNFRELLKRFPKSELSPDAKKRIAQLRFLLGKHEMLISRFYIRRGLRVSAIPRLREMVEKYKDIPELRAEALFYLGESYLLEESFKKAAEAYRLLISDYSISPFANKAYQRLLVLTKKK